MPAEALLQRASSLRWDRRTKKFIKGDGVGADNKKLIKSESGQKLPASFKSGVFDEWRRKQRVSVPKVGEAELKGRTVGVLGAPGEKRYRHKAGIPKTDAEKRQGRTVGKPGKPGSVGGGLKSADEIRKDRVLKAKREHLFLLWLRHTLVLIRFGDIRRREVDPAGQGQEDWASSEGRGRKQGAQVIVCQVTALLTASSRSCDLVCGPISSRSGRPCAGSAHFLVAELHLAELTLSIRRLSGNVVPIDRASQWYLRLTSRPPVAGSGPGVRVHECRSCGRPEAIF